MSGASSSFSLLSPLPRSALKGPARPASLRGAAAAGVLLCFVAGAGCGASHEVLEAAGPDVTTSTVTFLTAKGDETFAVEVADNPQELSRGLMFRKSLLPRTGMLFVFPDEREHFFWMKNTYISLDMIFIDSTARVVGVIAGAEPLSTASLTVRRPSKYVVEVNAGAAAESGIVEGTAARLQIASGPR